jgi:hypothetical protein
VYNWDVENPNNPHWDASPSLVRRFVWSGWLMLMELDALDDNAVLKKYTWGLDLAGLSGSVDKDTRSLGRCYNSDRSSFTTKERPS